MCECGGGAWSGPYALARVRARAATPPVRGAAGPSRPMRSASMIERACGRSRSAYDCRGGIAVDLISPRFIRAMVHPWFDVHFRGLAWPRRQQAGATRDPKRHTRAGGAAYASCI